MSLVAPVFSYVYADSGLTALIRVAGLIVVISGVKNVQQAYIARNMQFKSFFFATLIGTMVSAIIGIFMALNDYGVWAIIIRSVISPTFVSGHHP